ncbi:MAG: hypothetical protein QXF82_09220 [Nitrososphaeria archaeon]
MTDQEALLLKSNSYYDLTKTYLLALAKDSNVYDKSWLLFTEYFTNEKIDIKEVESIVNRLLQDPKKTAWRAFDSMALLRLLCILEKEKKMENLDQDKLREWIEEIKRSKWYSVEDLVYSAEFHGFYVALGIFKEENPIIGRVLENIEENLRTYLWILFGLTLGSKEKRVMAKEYLTKIVTEYRGLIEKDIIRLADIEYWSIYLFLLSEHSFGDELERIYPEFEKEVSRTLLKSDWILKAVKTARDIQTGVSDENIIVIQPEEISVFYPRHFALASIAIYRSLSKFREKEEEYKKFIMKIRAEGKVIVTNSKKYKFAQICIFAFFISVFWLMGYFINLILNQEMVQITLTILGAILGFIISSNKLKFFEEYTIR